MSKLSYAFLLFSTQHSLCLLVFCEFKIRPLNLLQSFSVCLGKFCLIASFSSSPSQEIERERKHQKGWEPSRSASPAVVKTKNYTLFSNTTNVRVYPLLTTKQQSLCCCSLFRWKLIVNVGKIKELYA